MYNHDRDLRNEINSPHKPKEIKYSKKEFCRIRTELFKIPGNFPNGITPNNKAWELYQNWIPYNRDTNRLFPILDIMIKKPVKSILYVRDPENRIREFAKLIIESGKVVVVDV